MDKPNTGLPDGGNPTPSDLIRTYEHMGHDSIAREMEKGVVPCVALVPGSPSATGGSRSRSKIGGSPDLPNPGLWPLHNGKHLSFVAQLNLKEVPDLPGSAILPKEGMLYFFYDSEQSTWGFDPKDKGSWRVLYREEVPSSGVATDYPEDIPNRARFAERFVRLQPASSVPDIYDVLQKTPSLTEGQMQEVCSVFAEYEEMRAPMHQLLGRPAQVEGDMRLECQLVSHGLYCGDETGYSDPRAKALEAGAADWRLLLQVDTDDEAGMMWGDCGRLYFWIREDDLRERAFENSWMILQCY
jgi:uncharacterized protein YwqG